MVQCPDGGTNEHCIDYHRPSDSGLSDLGLAGILPVALLHDPPQLARLVVGGL